MDEQRRILGLGTRRTSWGRVVGGRVRCNLGSQRKQIGQQGCLGCSARHYCLIAPQLSSEAWLHWSLLLLSQEYSCHPASLLLHTVLCSYLCLTVTCVLSCVVICDKVGKVPFFFPGHTVMEEPPSRVTCALTNEQHRVVKLLFLCSLGDISFQLTQILFQEAGLWGIQRSSNSAGLRIPESQNRHCPIKEHKQGRRKKAPLTGADCFA